MCKSMITSLIYNVIQASCISLYPSLHQPTLSSHDQGDLLCKYRAVLDKLYNKKLPTRLVQKLEHLETVSQR